MKPPYVTAAVPISHLGSSHTTTTLRETCNTGRHQPIHRKGIVLAVLIPYLWHQEHLDSCPAVTEPRTLTVMELRSQAWELLDRVHQEQRHYVITSDGYVVASLVPVDWVVVASGIPSSIYRGRT